MGKLFVININCYVLKGSKKLYNNYNLGNSDLGEAITNYLEGYSNGYKYIDTLSKKTIYKKDQISYNLIINQDLFIQENLDLQGFIQKIQIEIQNIYQNCNALVNTDGKYDSVVNTFDSTINGGGYFMSFFLKDGVPLSPIANFKVNYDPNQFPTDIKIIDQSKNSVRYQYDFGDGEKSTLKEPNKTYITEGTYNVVLTTLSSDNLSSTYSQTITIKKKLDFIVETKTQDKNSNNPDTKPQNQVDKTSNVNETKPDEKATNIQIQTPNDPDFQNEFIRGSGFYPVIYYNSLLIDNSSIDYFSLYNDGFIPCIKLNFRDSSGMMKSKSFPLDDTKIKVFISSRANNLNSIILDFKISNFSNNDGLMMIDGILNSSKLYTKNYKVYSNSTSYNALKQISKDIGIGFNSNINDSNDKMNWLQNGKKFSDFIESIVQRSYISDKTFLAGYIDYHQCFNYIDIEKEMDRDISEQHGINTTGLEVANGTNEKPDIQPLFLTNDESMLQSNNYFSKFRVINRSSEISVDTGYIQNTSFYDRNKKQLVSFKIDSITKNEDSKIILKGDPKYSDENVNNNQNHHYLGKLDTSNVHSNYFYTKINNWKNITDLGKIEIEVEMGNPNFNFYQFQKVNLILSNKSPMAGDDSMINERLSGEWLLIDIEYTFTQNKFVQSFRLVKRELELSKEELEAEKNNTNTNYKKENSENTTNPEPSPETTGTPTLIDYSVPIKVPTTQTKYNTNLPKKTDQKSRIFKTYTYKSLYPIIQQLGIPKGIGILMLAHALHEGWGGIEDGDPQMVAVDANHRTRRCNNPGALRYSSIYSIFNPVSDTPKNGYCKFPSVINGVNALYFLITRIKNGQNSNFPLAGNSPLWNGNPKTGYMDIYAPISDNNNPHAYAIDVLSDFNSFGISGLTTDTTINQLFGIK
jgi:hypothetical protein